MLNRGRLFATPRTAQSMEFSRPEYWSGYPIPFPRDLPDPGIDLGSLTLQADSLPAELPEKPKNTAVRILNLLQRIFPTQELNYSLLHCRRILYQLSYQGSPVHRVRPEILPLSSIPPFLSHCTYSEVTQSCLTLCNPVDCSLPRSSVHGIFPGKRTGVGCHFLLQRIFPTQGSNPYLLCLWHCKWIFLPLSHQGRSP